jgi:preprotein translocase subunit SecE
MADKFKFALAVLLLVAGVAGFYLLAEQAMILRVLAVMAGPAWLPRLPGRPSRGVVSSTLQESPPPKREKVVWPSRKETMQTTGLVFRVRRGDGPLSLADRQEPGMAAVRPGSWVEEI